MTLKPHHLLIPLTLAAVHVAAAKTDDYAPTAAPLWDVMLAPQLSASDFAVLRTANLERGSYRTPFSPDYVISYERDARSNRYTVFDTSIAHDVGVTTTSFAASADPHLASLTRLESSWSWQLPDSGAKLRLGDGVSSPGTWGQAVRFGGVQIGTASNTRSDLVMSPLLGSSGMAVLPSTADLLSAELRDAVVRGSGIAPVVPQSVKPGSVNLLVNDALGRSYVVARPLFQSIALMPRGESDFSLEAGRVRENFGRRSDQYGAWLVSGTYRYGLGKTTFDAHAAAIDNEISVMGVGLSESIGSLGLVSATMATSRTTDNSGWLARMGYEVTVDGVNLAIRSHLQSLSFQDLRVATVGIEPLRERTLASAGVALDRFGNVSVAGVTQSFGDGEREGLLALSHSVPIGYGGMFSTAATFAPGPAHGSAVLLAVRYPFTAGKRKTSVVTRNMINNINDQNLVLVLDGARPVK